MALIAIPHAIQYGPQSSYIAENFPTGLAYAWQRPGLPDRLTDRPAARHPCSRPGCCRIFGWQAIAVYIIACVVLTLFAVALLPDRSRADLAGTPVLAPAERRTAGRAAGG